jgi:hypothetical protein
MHVVVSSGHSISELRVQSFVYNYNDHRPCTFALATGYIQDRPGHDDKLHDKGTKVACSPFQV